MRKIILLILIILAGLACIIGYLLFGASAQILGQKSFGMQLTVSDTLGFNIDTNAVYFGKATPNSMVKRDIIVNNNLMERALVVFEKSGELAGWVTPSLNEFYLNPGESKSVTLTAKIPNDAKMAEYSGKIVVYFMKAHN